MATFEQLQKANESIRTVNIKGKEYAEVNQRIKAFRMVYPEGFINTDMKSNENGICIFHAAVGYYVEKEGFLDRVTLGTGTAYEKESSTFINKTSYIENCETSAVGRALGFLGLGIDGGGICSAEELMNAVNNQGRIIPAVNTPEPSNNGALDLAVIRERLGAAIKEKTKDMSKAEKIQFLNTVVTPALNGERNWRLCENVGLLMTLLSRIEEKAA